MLLQIDDEISNSVQNFNNVLEDYTQAIIASLSAIEECSNVLKGKSYEKFIQNLHKKADVHKELVAELQILCEKIEQYLNEMVDTESAISFDN